MSNYKDWIEAINIEIDYFSAFLKAYIAFNSWYNEVYPQLKTDRAIIDTIKETNNRFRTYINNFLAKITPLSSDEDKAFQDNFAKLHSALCQAAVTTQEYGGVTKQISFSDIAIKNKNNQSTHTYRGINYCTKKAGGKFKVEVKDSSNLLIFDYEQEAHNFEEISQQSAYGQLSPERQTQLKICYDKMQPYNNISVIFTGTNRGREDENVKLMGSYEFINDNNKLSGALIEVFYLLRCALAHGDVSPDKNANSVYMYAYELLAMTLRKLL